MAGKHRSSRGGFGVDAPGDETEDEIQAPQITVVDEQGNVLDDDGNVVQRAGGDAPAPAVAAADDTDTDTRFTNLERNLADMKRERDAANERAVAAERAVHEHAGDVHQSQGAVIASGLSMAKNELDSAREAYQRARAANDALAELDAITAINQAQADIREFEAAAAEFKATPAPRRQPAATTQPTQADLTYAQQVDQMLGTWTPAAQEFARKNYDKMFDEADPKKLQRVVGAHQLALGEGLAVDSPEYFAFIEDKAGLKNGGSVPRANPKQQRRSNVPSAPARRVGGGSIPAGTQEALSQKQIEFCRRTGITTAEYAANLYAAKENGRDPESTGHRLAADRNYVRRA